jgi:hypothetical protein
MPPRPLVGCMGLPSVNSLTSQQAIYDVTLPLDLRETEQGTGLDRREELEHLLGSPMRR